jgi:hypothetical protein
MLGDELKARNLGRQGMTLKAEVVHSPDDLFIPILRGTKQATREIAALQREASQHQRRMAFYQERIAANQERGLGTQESMAQSIEALSAVMCMVLKELQAANLTLG